MYTDSWKGQSGILHTNSLWSYNWDVKSCMDSRCFMKKRRNSIFHDVISRFISNDPKCGGKCFNYNLVSIDWIKLLKRHSSTIVPETYVKLIPLTSKTGWYFSFLYLELRRNMAADSDLKVVITKWGIKLK